MTETRRVIDLIVGARPNFIKAACVYRSLNLNRRLKPRLVHTGQHYHARMSDVFFRDLDLAEPSVNLGVGSGSHGFQTAKILEAYEAHLLRERPAGVIVLGDVNSTLACALAAAKLNIPVAHIEAGLRSFDRCMPEEINRRLSDAMADLLFVTEAVGLDNLLREGIDEHRTHLVGNVMADTLLAYQHRFKTPESIAGNGLARRSYGLVTVHRAANVDDPLTLEHLMRTILKCTRNLYLLFPLHPRTKKQLERAGLKELFDGQLAGKLRIMEPLSYIENLSLMSGAKMVITDSGGIQAEATILNIPCLTLREITEQPVTVEMGTNTLVGHSEEMLGEAFSKVMDGSYKLAQPIPFWDGKASERIASVLEESW